MDWTRSENFNKSYQDTKFMSCRLNISTVLSTVVRKRKRRYTYTTMINTMTSSRVCLPSSIKTIIVPSARRDMTIKRNMHVTTHATTARKFILKQKTNGSHVTTATGSSKDKHVMICINKPPAKETQHVQLIRDVKTVIQPLTKT